MRLINSLHETRFMTLKAMAAKSGPEISDRDEQNVVHIDISRLSLRIAGT